MDQVPQDRQVPRPSPELAATLVLKGGWEALRGAAALAGRGAAGDRRVGVAAQHHPVRIAALGAVTPDPSLAGCREIDIFSAVHTTLHAAADATGECRK